MLVQSGLHQHRIIHHLPKNEVNCEKTSALHSGSSCRMVSNFRTSARNFVLETKSTFSSVTAWAGSPLVSGLRRFRCRWTERRSDSLTGPLSQMGQLAGLFWSSHDPMKLTMQSWHLGSDGHRYSLPSVVAWKENLVKDFAGADKALRFVLRLAEAF
jgi:hypothetical protein